MFKTENDAESFSFQKELREKKYDFQWDNETTMFMNGFLQIKPTNQIN